MKIVHTCKKKTIKQIPLNTILFRQNGYASGLYILSYNT